jgi:hypothetical protein
LQLSTLRLQLQELWRARLLHPQLVDDRLQLHLAKLHFLFEPFRLFLKRHQLGLQRRVRFDDAVHVQERDRQFRVGGRGNGRGKSHVGQEDGAG